MFGNRLTRGGDNFQTRVNQGSSVKPNDNGDDTYTARLDLAVGVFRIDIALDGEPIRPATHLPGGIGGWAPGPLSSRTRWKRQASNRPEGRVPARQPGCSLVARTARLSMYNARAGDDSVKP